MQLVFAVGEDSQAAWLGGNGACPKRLRLSSGCSEDAVRPRTVRKKAANLLDLD